MMRLLPGGTAAIALTPNATGTTALRALLHASLLDKVSGTYAYSRSDGLAEERMCLELSLEQAEGAWGGFEAAMALVGWQQVALSLEGEGSKRVSVSLE